MSTLGFIVPLKHLLSLLLAHIEHKAEKVYFWVKSRKSPGYLFLSAALVLTGVLTFWWIRRDLLEWLQASVCFECVSQRLGSLHPHRVSTQAETVGKRTQSRSGKTWNTENYLCGNKTYLILTIYIEQICLLLDCWTWEFFAANCRVSF